MTVETQPIEAQRFSEAEAPLVSPRREFVDRGMPVLEGVPRLPSGELFSELQKRLAPARLMPLIESIGDHAVRVVGLPAAVTERLRSRPSPLIHILLFAATLVTTIYAGALYRGVSLLDEPARCGVGLPYALALLAILGVHEFGHLSWRGSTASTSPFHTSFRCRWGLEPSALSSR